MNKDSGNLISFFTEEDEEVKFRVLEETKLNGVCYLLVMEDGDEESAYIMKDVSNPEDGEAIYDMVEDEKELSLIGSIFEELLDDVDIITE